MFFDNLTVAGVAIVSLYGFLPLLFGREFIRVEDDKTRCLKAPSECGPVPMASPVFAADDAA